MCEVQYGDAPLWKGLKLFIFKRGWVLIKVTRLNGDQYWLNPHQIETMEMHPDTTVTLISGKKLVVKETPKDVLIKIIVYRRKLGQFGNEQ
jgi:flagellar protein FlbD